MAASNLTDEILFVNAIVLLKKQLRLEHFTECGLRGRRIASRTRSALPARGLAAP